MFLEYALLALKNILELPCPHNLLELRLVDCQSSTKVLKRLVDLLANETCYLRSIALVQMKINFPLHGIAKLLDHDTLHDLDISANDC